MKSKYARSFQFCVATCRSGVTGGIRAKAVFDQSHMIAYSLNNLFFINTFNRFSLIFVE